MYKNRFKKWGFDQKYRKRSCHARWPNKHQPQERFSDGLCLMSPDDSSPLSTNGDTSTGGSSTERADWSPNEDPTMGVFTTLQNSGKLEHAIFRYFHASFQSRLWVSDGEGTHCRSVKASPSIWEMISTFKRDLIAACNYIRQQGTRYAFVYLHQGSEKIEDLVSAESPRVIADLIEISLWLIKQDRYDVVRIFLQQFADMSAVLKSKSHAIYRILAQRSQLDVLTFEEVALNAWWSIATCFCHELGSMHVTTLSCYTNWLMYFANTSVCARHICQTKCCHSEYAENVLRSHLQRCDDAHGRVSTQSMMVVEALVHVLLLRHNYSAAEVLCHEIIGCKQTEQRHKILFMALQSISEAKRAQRKSGDAEESLKKLVDISDWGRNSSKAIYHMTLLEDCLINTDKSEEATNIKANRNEHALGTDPLSVSLTQSSTWLNSGVRAFAPATEENIVRLRSSTRFSERDSQHGNFLERAFRNMPKMQQGTANL
jgi:hypothetical protein